MYVSSAAQDLALSFPVYSASLRRRQGSAHSPAEPSPPPRRKRSQGRRGERLAVLGWMGGLALAGWATGTLLQHGQRSNPAALGLPPRPPAQPKAGRGPWIGAGVLAGAAIGVGRAVGLRCKKTVLGIL